MRDVKRRYWDAGIGGKPGEKPGGWVHDTEPIPSVEDEIFNLIYRLEDECSFAPEVVLALECLTPKQRFVIECRFGFNILGPMTERDIALTMGVTQRAVQKLIKRALRRLEKQMQGVVTDAK